jgi:hypothetical protein
MRTNELRSGGSSSRPVSLSEGSGYLRVLAGATKLKEVARTMAKDLTYGSTVSGDPDYDPRLVAIEQQYRGKPASLHNALIRYALEASSASEPPDEVMAELSSKEQIVYRQLCISGPTRTDDLRQALYGDRPRSVEAHRQVIKGLRVKLERMNRPETVKYNDPYWVLDRG